jgi:hypothetical protein
MGRRSHGRGELIIDNSDYTAGNYILKTDYIYGYPLIKNMTISGKLLDHRR